MKHNTYFDGAVQSIGFAHDTGAATVGVMAPGAYEFSTGKPEKMDVVAGVIDVKLPGGEWKTYKAGESFNVPGEAKFNVRMQVEVAYVCWFV
jgi:uncharacterized protein YaiE (UPF0345 family)